MGALSTLIGARMFGQPNTLFAARAAPYPSPMWKAIRGASQIECFHPTQAGTISGTNVGPELGNAQLLEAPARWNRKMGRRTAAYADVQRGDVLRRMAALQQKLRARHISRRNSTRNSLCQRKNSASGTVWRD